MRHIEWLVLLVTAACGTGPANLIGCGVGFDDSIPGLVVLTVISMAAMVPIKVLPLRLPIVVYCSIIGLLSASSISPTKELVIQVAANINSTASSTMVGAFVDPATGDQLKTFISQGWKIPIVEIFAMMGTFLGSCLWDQMLLVLAGAI